MLPLRGIAKGKLIFPSHCGCDRPAVLEHPSVFVSYAVKGVLDDIYATLVAKLACELCFTDEALLFRPVGAWVWLGC